ncbi:actin-related protein 2/3 complex subunit 5-B [Daktulosphaira vitifoliae]|uniref:actin-related protein 2/3 complex subunit 5-B n=1 Tax=Daktulosphaira vitifoliae TaxID=58002 RepID=UPI0021A97BB0|nr:actin-related protein 2/3 complex subunit 5-B [Daktulosphaira vitifoliae]
MSSNTRSSAFRKIDVDQFNENFKDDEQTEFQSPTSIPDEAEITKLINQGNLAEALKSALKNAPLGSKNQQLKDNALNVVMKVLLGTKVSQIDEVVAQLDIDTIDILMKYIYKGFEKSTEKKSSHLLMWHEKAYALGGAGSIIRVLTERKRV